MIPTIQRRSISDRACGSVTLEAAIAVLIFLSLLLGGLAAGDLFRQTTSLRESMDQALHASVPRPFSLKQVSGELEVVTDPSSLSEAILKVAETLANSIQTRLGLPESEYQVLVSYSLVEIDPFEGSALRLTSPTVQQQVSVGTLSLPPELLSKYDLERKVVALASFDGAFPNPNFQWSTPSALYGLTSKNQFFPVVVVIGVRTAISLTSSPLARTISDMLGSPYIVATRLNPLRGDLTL